MKHQGWGEGRFELTREQVELLVRYEGLLLEHAVPRGMIASADAGILRERHLEDSLKATGLIRPTDRSALDIGSGAGPPGVVLGIAHQTLDVTLVDNRRSRAAFLERVVRELGLLRVTAVHASVDDLAIAVDVCFARAFGPPARSWEAAAPHLRPDGRLLYWAGRSFRPEDVPRGLQFEVIETIDLASSGPVVIMWQQ